MKTTAMISKESLNVTLRILLMLSVLCLCSHALAEDPVKSNNTRKISSPGRQGSVSEQMSGDSAENAEAPVTTSGGYVYEVEIDICTLEHYRGEEITLIELMILHTDPVYEFDGNIIRVMPVHVLCGKVIRFRCDLRNPSCETPVRILERIERIQASNRRKTDPAILFMN